MRGGEVSLVVPVSVPVSVSVSVPVPVSVSVPVPVSVSVFAMVAGALRVFTPARLAVGGIVHHRQTGDF